MDYLKCMETQLIARSPPGGYSPKAKAAAVKHLKACTDCREILRDDRVPFSHLVPEEERREALASDAEAP